MRGADRRLVHTLGRRLQGGQPVAPDRGEWGVVQSTIAGSTNAVGITIGASLSPTLTANYLASYTPTIGDVVRFIVDDYGVPIVQGKLK